MPGIKITAWRGRGNPAQCHRCQQFRHSSKNCHRPLTCVRCAEEHLARDCPVPRTERPQCANCRGQHAANSKKCPVYIAEARNKQAGTISRTGAARPTRPIRPDMTPSLPEQEMPPPPPSATSLMAEANDPIPRRTPSTAYEQRPKKKRVRTRRVRRTTSSAAPTDSELETSTPPASDREDIAAAPPRPQRPPRTPRTPRAPRGPRAREEDATATRAVSGAAPAALAATLASAATTAPAHRPVSRGRAAGTSDRDNQATIRAAPVAIPPPPPRPARDWEVFSQRLHNSTPNFPVVSAEDVENLTQQITASITSAMEAASQTATSHSRKRDALPSHIADLIKEKKKLRRRWQATRCPQLKTELNRLTDRVKTAMREKNAADWTRCILEAGEDWQSLHRLCRNLTHATAPTRRWR
ncbi:uncharacterized protein DKFZp434B061-like [Aricia agestis]|uniref:uncharacterized protein DKFZp434B061-like n=1 Tax=Aricia agestis TaxID=91739 RepID=UPI001C2029ED|nr:uncharacterized protein DKFZp434B061-like [Aricia agestis]